MATVTYQRRTKSGRVITVTRKKNPPKPKPLKKLSYQKKLKVGR